MSGSQALSRLSSWKTLALTIDRAKEKGAESRTRPLPPRDSPGSSVESGGGPLPLWVPRTTNESSGWLSPTWWYSGPIVRAPLGGWAAIS